MTLPFSSEVNGTGILEVSYLCLFDCHFSFAVHREIGLAINVISFEDIGGGLIVSGILRDDWLSFEIVDDEAEDIFCVINSISAYGVDHQGEALFCFLEHGDGLMDFADVGRVGYFPKGELLFSIGDDMISVAPEVPDLFLEGVREMDQDAQSSIGVSFWPFSFIEALGDRAFEVVLPHLG